MTHPLVIHMHDFDRSRGDVKIDRTTIWGNPFFISKSLPRSACIARYRAWLLTQPKLLALLPTLRGKRLACWCAGKHSDCHGDILAELANPAGVTIPPPQSSKEV